MTETKDTHGDAETLRKVLENLKSNARGWHGIELTPTETVLLAGHLELLEVEAMEPPDLAERISRVETVLETLLAFATPERIVLGDGIVRIYSGSMGRAVEIVDERNPVGTPSRVEEVAGGILGAPGGKPSRFTVEPTLLEKTLRPARVDWDKPIRTIDGRPAKLADIFENLTLARVTIEASATYDYNLDTGRPLDLGPFLENVQAEA